MAPRGPKRCPKKIARRELQWDPCLRTEAASGELAKGRLSDGCFPLGNARFAVCGFRSPTATEYFERNYQSNASHPLSATPLSQASTIMLHLVGWITVVHINFVSWVHIFSDDVRHRAAGATRACSWGGAKAGGPRCLQEGVGTVRRVPRRPKKLPRRLKRASIFPHEMPQWKEAPLCKSCYARKGEGMMREGGMRHAAGIDPSLAHRRFQAPSSYVGVFGPPLRP